MTKKLSLLDIWKKETILPRMLAALRFLFLKHILDKNKILCKLHTAVKINSLEGVDVQLKVDLFPTIFFREIKKWT